MVDDVLETIANYVVAPPPFSDEAYRTAKHCLADALGCAVLSLQHPACTKLLGSTVPGTTVAGGCRIPGTDFILDPVCGAFNLGTMIRWLDFNDTWLAAEWGHPSDNIGGILCIADYISQQNIGNNTPPLTIQNLLSAIIKAYEIQGGLALLNSFNRIGWDHVFLVKIATAAVGTHLLGGTKEQIIAALSQAFIDTGPLRTYRHAPNTGSRKSWAAGDATSRGIWLALMTMRGEQGYSTPLTTPKWGLYDALLKGQPLAFQRALGCYVMENILFKVAFPAEFHAQTAVEASFQLYPLIKNRWNDIQTITLYTHESAIRIIDKKEALRNPADRDHCLQYMTAIGLLKGSLSADDYEDEAAKNPMIDELRNKMQVLERKQYSEDYLNPEKRSIANALSIQFKDGTKTEEVAVEYPLGHRRRREEGIPLLFDKLRTNLDSRYSLEQTERLVALFKEDDNTLQLMSVPQFVEMFVLCE